MADNILQIRNGGISPININNPKGLTNEADVKYAICKAQSVVRTTMTIAYGMAYYTSLDAIDRVKEHKSIYKHDVKAAFKHVMEELNGWKTRLLHAETRRFFSVKDMKPEFKRRYKDDLTDREFFDMWLDVGAYAYGRYRPMLVALQYKYEKMMREHNQKYCKMLSWVITCSAAMDIAQGTYLSMVDKIYLAFGLPKEDVNSMFGDFSLGKVRKSWVKAAKLMLRYCSEYDLTDDDVKNIKLGLDDIYKSYAQQFEDYDMQVMVIEDNEEMFKSKGMHKKCVRELNEKNNEFKRSVEECNLEERKAKLKRK